MFENSSGNFTFRMLALARYNNILILINELFYGTFFGFCIFMTVAICFLMV